MVSDAKIKELIKDLTLDEKLKMIHGAEYQMCAMLSNAIHHSAACFF